MKIFFYCEKWFYLLEDMGFNIDERIDDVPSSFEMECDFIPRIGEKINLYGNPFSNAKNNILSDASDDELEQLRVVIHGCYKVEDVIYHGDFSEDGSFMGSHLSILLEKILDERFSITNYLIQKRHGQ